MSRVKNQAGQDDELTLELVAFEVPFDQRTEQVAEPSGDTAMRFHPSTELRAAIRLMTQSFIVLCLVAAPSSSGADYSTPDRCCSRHCIDAPLSRLPF